MTECETCEFEGDTEMCSERYYVIGAEKCHSRYFVVYDSSTSTKTGEET